MELSCVRWSNAAMRCRYAATRALQFRLPASMAACAWAIPSSTTGIAGAPVWHSPPLLEVPQSDAHWAGAVGWAAAGGAVVLRGRQRPGQ